jgi:hypothetical protein
MASLPPLLKHGQGNKKTSRLRREGEYFIKPKY